MAHGKLPPIQLTDLFPLPPLGVTAACDKEVPSRCRSMLHGKIDVCNELERSAVPRCGRLADTDTGSQVMPLLSTFCKPHLPMATFHLFIWTINCGARINRDDGGKNPSPLLSPCAAKLNES